mmetsp:Transcript_20993/g.42353  ORF Transcript_20993/g.42353 Transcript_20993/m.42353 type:complete len:219 (-) Transcript_20993:318-974(-)
MRGSADGVARGGGGGRTEGRRDGSRSRGGVGPVEARPLGFPLFAVVRLVPAEEGAAAQDHGLEVLQFLAFPRGGRGGGEARRKANGAGGDGRQCLGSVVVVLRALLGARGGLLLPLLGHGQSLLGLGELSLKSPNQGTIVQDLVLFALEVDHLGPGRELERGPCLLDVPVGRGGAAEDSHAGVAGEGRLKDAGELGVAVVNVGGALVGGHAEGVNDLG